MQCALSTCPAASLSGPSSTCQLRRAAPFSAPCSNGDHVRHAARVRLARQRVAAPMAASQQSTLVTTGSSAATATVTDKAPEVASDTMLHVVDVPMTSHEDAVMMQGGQGMLGAGWRCLLAVDLWCRVVKAMHSPGANCYRPCAAGIWSVSGRPFP
jgi:hypothetical protein